MKTKIISAEKISGGELAKAPVELSKLPVGEYQGLWGGYAARVEMDGVHYRLKTEIGIRTQAAPCVVFIKAGEATIETG